MERKEFFRDLGKLSAAGLGVLVFGGEHASDIQFGRCTGHGTGDEVSRQYISGKG
jgi:hypothetical protein